MQFALIADIHANALALEAILDDIRKKKPDGIISLGDQLNLGPNGQEVNQMLRASNAIMLRGNHERYIEAAKRHDPAYNGANFALMRHQAESATEADYALPSVFQYEHVTFCHAMPDNDAFPVYDPKRALPLLRAMTFDKPTTIVCGHGHNPISYALPNLAYYCIGSAGSMDSGTPGNTRYMLATIEQSSMILEPVFVPYDTREIPRRFIESGQADAFPITSRLACMQESDNYDYLLPFVHIALELSAEKGETLVSMETWEETDRKFGWKDGLTAPAFWENERQKLRK